MQPETCESRKLTREYGSGRASERLPARALDVAADYYLRMCGGSAAIPTGKLAELLEAAEEQGSLTAPEIATNLDTEELPIDAEVAWTIGKN